MDTIPQAQHSSNPPKSDLILYFHTSVFSLIIFGLCYGYTSWLGITGTLNKSVADTAIWLIGFSFILSSLCYFWNIFDHFILYRKHLGVLGFVFGVIHLLLSWEAFTYLFLSQTWSESKYWAPLSGTIAFIIFAIMTAVSNTMAARLLGGKIWRKILRLGYIAIALVFAHVVVLKGARWVTWFSEGMISPPSMSMIVSLFMIVVICLRILLGLRLKQKKGELSETPQSKSNTTISDYENALSLIKAHEAWLESGQSTGKPQTLKNLDLTGINLSNRKLHKITLIDVNLSNANLSSSDLSESTLTRVKFDHASLKVANLDYVLARELQANSADFSGSSIIKSSFNDSSLSQADFSKTKFIRTSFLDCQLDQSIWGESTHLRTLFHGCSLVNARFDQATLDQVSFVNSHVSGISGPVKSIGATYVNNTLVDESIQIDAGELDEMLSRL